MKTKFFLSFFCMFACLSLSSCVTLFGAYKKVHISSTPTGASVYRDDGKYVGKTPLTYKGKAHHGFEISMTGYEKDFIYPESKFNLLYLANALNLYGILEFNNIETFKEKESYYNVSLKPKQTQTSTPSPVRESRLLEMVSSNADNYTCRNALSRIKPTYSNPAGKVILKGSEVFKRYTNAVFMLYGATYEGMNVWQGSGFFVNSEGLAVSNYHNFEKATEIAVKLYGSDSYINITKDDILAYSRNEDYIIFKVRGMYGNPFIPIANKRCEVGDKIYTIGSPRGLENTFSSGEVSQYRTEQGYIQITAPIDHGSSGGVLINEYGEAIGITSAGRDDSGANLNFCKDLLYIMNRYK